MGHYIETRKNQSRIHIEQLMVSGQVSGVFLLSGDLVALRCIDIIKFNERSPDFWTPISL